LVKKVLADAIKGNRRYIEESDDTIWGVIQKGQSPKITLVTCSDSRVSGHVFGKDTVNHVFHIRNIGNQIENNFGSVDYGVHHLHTPILMILGHTDCGAVKASQTDFSNETDEIKKELYPLYFSLGKKAQGQDMKNPSVVSKLVQHNVDVQVKEAVKRYGTSGLYIIGAVFDIHDHYGGKAGGIVITNINGLTEQRELLKHPLIAELEDHLKDIVVKRL
jgi:carbonic anhydrase